MIYAISDRYQHASCSPPGSVFHFVIDIIAWNVPLVRFFVDSGFLEANEIYGLGLNIALELA